MARVAAGCVRHRGTGVHPLCLRGSMVPATLAAAFVRREHWPVIGKRNRRVRVCSPSFSATVFFLTAADVPALPHSPAAFLLHRRTALFACCLALLAPLAACRAESAARASAITIVDGDGRTIRLDTPAQRVVSLVPASTDVLLALGASDRVVARTDYDQDPRLAAVPAVDNALTPSVEWIAQQRPDLVIAWPDRQTRTIVGRLIELGVPVYASHTESLADARKNMHDIGALLGLDSAAMHLVGALDSAMAAARAQVANLPRVSVLYLIGLDPPMAAGSGTFVNELIDVAGGANVVRASPTRWPELSVEDVLAKQPHVIVAAVEAQSAEQVRSRLSASPGWRTLDAVRAGRVFVVDATRFNRPGPLLISAIHSLVVAIHPESARP